MKPFASLRTNAGTAGRRRRTARDVLSINQQGSAPIRTLTVAGVGIAVGIGLAGMWQSHRQALPMAPAESAQTPGSSAAPPRGADSATHESGALSAATKTLLQRLPAAVEIRYYAVLDPAAVTDAMKSFAKRSARLLEAYQQEAAGKITLTRLESPADAPAALADGMKPFNLDQGAACYLGVSVAQGARKEALSRLVPEWEPALESDISRAISRVLAPSVPASPPPGTPAAAPDPNALAEVKRQIPNFADVSLDEGSRTLRQSAMKELQSALGEMQSQIKAAEQSLAQLDTTTSGPERQAALQKLQELQARQVEKLRELTIKSTAQIEALRQLKESAK